jgi:hypothetical protein
MPRSMSRLKLSLLSLLAFISFATSGIAGEQRASARLWCESLHFSQGHNGDETLDLSTIAGVPNGELAPNYDGKSLVSGFMLDLFGMPIYGTIYVGLPAFADDDGDGFDDFYQTSHQVSATTSGTFETDVSSGTLSATWNRGSDSKDGSCVLNLVDSIYGMLGGFSHGFEVLEYTGSLFYTAGKTTVSNRFALLQTGSPDQQFTGKFVLTKDGVDRYNKLQLPSGTWTNTTLGGLTVLETDIARDSRWPTNYYGFIDFEDGDPRTTAADYLYWTISIDDLNDSNKNGVPDFSDDPTIRAPRLAITLTGDSLKLQIEGETGRTLQLQETSAPAIEPWKTVDNLILTNDLQVISIPRPQENRFWRVVAQ